MLQVNFVKSFFQTKTCCSSFCKCVGFFWLVGTGPQKTMFIVIERKHCYFPLVCSSSRSLLDDRYLKCSHYVMYPVLCKNVAGCLVLQDLFFFLVRLGTQTSFLISYSGERCPCDCDAARQGRGL